MRFNTLQAWLSWQENLHVSEIDLGLERVAQVAQTMGIPSQWSIPVITVAGTNGKGSSVAILESLFHHAGYRVGSFTSPHLLHYNERIKLNRQAVDDTLICQAFEKVDQARLLADSTAISLTYFEFGTLAALYILQQAELDVVVLEVGLGGRLDAVNIIDAMIALITPIAIDHQSWLGDSRETIAFEKAGIIKPNTKVVYNDVDPSPVVLKQAENQQATLYLLNKDYQMREADGQAYYQSQSMQLEDLNLPALAGAHQLDNAAAAIQVFELLQPALSLSETAISAALADIQLAGRFQQLASAPAIFIDVAHNEHAVQSLAANLRQHPCKGRTYAVLAMLEDKQIETALRDIDESIDAYYLAGLEGSRALSSEQLKQRLQVVVAGDKLSCHQQVENAMVAVLSTANADDRIIIFGSFLTVTAAMQFLTSRA